MSQFYYSTTAQNSLQQSRLARYLGPLMIVTGMLAVLAGCSHPPDETQIRNTLASMVEAVENRERRAVRKHLADDFRAEHRQQQVDINRLMLFYFRQHQNIKIFLSDELVTVNGNRADVQLKALLTGAEGLIPDAMRRYEVRMRWLKQDDEWKLSRINWQAENR